VITETIHPHKLNVFPTSNGIPFLGYRVFAKFRLLQKENVRRFKRRMRGIQASYGQNAIGLERVKQSLNGWLGHALQADTYQLRKRLFAEYAVFRRCGALQ